MGRGLGRRDPKHSLYQPYDHAGGAGGLAAGSRTAAFAASVGADRRDGQTLARVARARDGRGGGKNTPEPYYQRRRGAYGKHMPGCMLQNKRRFSSARQYFKNKIVQRGLRKASGALYFYYERHRPPPLAQPVQSGAQRTDFLSDRQRLAQGRG